MVISPTNRGGAVQVPAYQNPAMTPMSGQPQMGGQQVQHNPAQFVSNLLQNQGRQTGMISWDGNAADGYQDPYLAQLAESARLEGPDSMQMVRHKVSQAMEVYIRSLVNKSGMLHEVFNNTKDYFKLDKYSRLECPVHSKFMESIGRNPQYMQMIMRNSAAFFGYALIDVVKKNAGIDPEASPFNANNLSVATEHAVRSVLFLEMINWLDKSKIGRELAFNLPRSILETLGNLEKIRDYAAKVFGFFDAPSPYNDLKLTKEQPDAFNIVNVALTDTSWAEPTAYHRLPPGGIDSWMQEDINRYSKPTQYVPEPVQEHAEMTWGRKTTENDLHRLTRENIAHYNFRKYLIPVPELKDTYVADPMQWQYIERLFTEVPIGIWENTFVIIKCDIDLLNKGGLVEYQSTLHSLPRRTTMEHVLTDPSKVLPVLKADAESGVVVVELQQEEAIAKLKDEPIVPELEATGEKLTVVSTKDKINECTVSDIAEQSGFINSALTGSQKGTCSLIMIEGKTHFAMENPEETKYIKEQYPALFMTRKKDPNFTWMKLMYCLISLRKDPKVSKGVSDFIIACTTQQLNSTLTGHYGYDTDPSSNNFLKVDNCVEDFNELVEYARENSTQLFEDMHNLANNPLLANSYALIEDAVVSDASKPTSDILRERCLYVGREFLLYNVNSHTQPIFASGHKTTVQRSFFPALFTTLDKVTNINKGILLRFNDDKIWLAQRSVLTDDFLTLRVLKPDSVLPWTEFA